MGPVRRADADTRRVTGEGPGRRDLAKCRMRFLKTCSSSLGRLVWAAIELEDVVYRLCRSVRPRHGPYDDHPIGARIAEARRDLEERPDDRLRQQAAAWLAEAAAALGARNTILHAVPATFATDIEELRRGGGQPVLAYVPRGGRGPRVRTPMTVEALGLLTARLIAARTGWADLAPALWDRRPRWEDDSGPS